MGRRAAPGRRGKGGRLIGRRASGACGHWLRGGVTGDGRHHVGELAGAGGGAGRGHGARAPRGVSAARGSGRGTVRGGAPGAAPAPARAARPGGGT